MHCNFMIHVVTNIFVLSFLQSSLVLLFESICYTDTFVYIHLENCIFVPSSSKYTYIQIQVENFLTRHKHKLLWNMELLKHVFHVQMKCSVIIIIIWCLALCVLESVEVKSVHKLDICSSYMLCFSRIVQRKMKMDDLFDAFNIWWTKKCDNGCTDICPPK